jgi:hypothetical protein
MSAKADEKTKAITRKHFLDDAIVCTFENFFAFSTSNFLLLFFLDNLCTNEEEIAAPGSPKRDQHFILI